MGPIRVDVCCPSVLLVACCEAGDLSDVAGAAVKAHARRCPACGAAIHALDQARADLLGRSSRGRTDASRRAAEAILGMIQGRHADEPLAAC
jgi:hypothetical protein